MRSGGQIGSRSGSLQARPETLGGSGELLGLVPNNHWALQQAEQRAGARAHQRHQQFPTRERLAGIGDAFRASRLPQSSRKELRAISDTR